MLMVKHTMAADHYTSVYSVIYKAC